MRVLAALIALLVTSGLPDSIGSGSLHRDLSFRLKAEATRPRVADTPQTTGDFRLEAAATRSRVPGARPIPRGFRLQAEGPRAQPNNPAGTQQAPRRIISLIPAVTEMLFAIGAGPQIIAVSSFDRYPPDVEKLQRVGALIDPDVERILSLRPDLVAVFGSQTDLRAQLERAKVPVFTYTDAGLADIATTMRALGVRVGRAQPGENAARDLEARIAAVRTRVAGRSRPKTLIVFDREPFTLRGIYASGGIGFIHDMVEAAGGANVFGDLQRKAVQATTEQILTRLPEVILELRGDPIAPDVRRREVAAWQPLAALPAVRNGRVYLFGDPRTVIPGPRIAEAIELIARTLHPEVSR